MVPGIHFYPTVVPGTYCGSSVTIVVLGPIMKPLWSQGPIVDPLLYPGSIVVLVIHYGPIVDPLRSPSPGPIWFLGSIVIHGTDCAPIVVPETHIVVPETNFEPIVVSGTHCGPIVDPL